MLSRTIFCFSQNLLIIRIITDDEFIKNCVWSLFQLIKDASMSVSLITYQYTSHIKDSFLTQNLLLFSFVLSSLKYISDIIVKRRIRSSFQVNFHLLYIEILINPLQDTPHPHYPFSSSFVALQSAFRY